MIHFPTKTTLQRPWILCSLGYLGLVLGVFWVSQYIPYPYNFWVRFFVVFLVYIIPIFLPIALVYSVGKFFVRSSYFPKVLLFLSILLYVYAIVHQFHPVITHYETSSEKIAQQYTIALISDVHITPFNNTKFLQKTFGRIQHISPDFVLIAGDVFDDCLSFDQDIQDFFSQITIPTYIIPGNHDVYGDQVCIRNTFTSLSNPNITRLEDQIVLYNEEIQIVGFDEVGREKTVNTGLLSTIAKDMYTIAMIHQPIAVEHIAKHGVDIMVAGHTHKGQIFPFEYVVRMMYPYIYGEYMIDQMKLFVSSGIGFRGAPMRLGTDAEIVVINIKKQD